MHRRKWNIFEWNLTFNVGLSWACSMWDWVVFSFFFFFFFLFTVASHAGLLGDSLARLYVRWLADICALSVYMCTCMQAISNECVGSSSSLSLLSLLGWFFVSNRNTQRKRQIREIVRARTQSYILYAICAVENGIFFVAVATIVRALKTKPDMPNNCNIFEWEKKKKTTTKWNGKNYMYGLCVCMLYAHANIEEAALGRWNFLLVWSFVHSVGLICFGQHSSDVLALLKVGRKKIQM